MKAQQLPAGRYYIGDPCYVIDGDRWMDFLEPYWATEGGGVFDYDGHSVCVYQTQWGDGCYSASDGTTLGVDAGIIGAIPAVLMTTGDYGLGTEMEFDKPFECYRDQDGRLHFGSLSVMTGDEEGGDEW